MKGKPSHFAVYINDMERASEFYQKVFDWSFNSYGPEDFKQVSIKGENGDQELIGALQHRKYSPIDEKVIGFECSVTVDDIDETAKAVEQAGGSIVMPKTEIPQVGWVIKFRDTEDNLVCAIQYQ